MPDHTRIEAQHPSDFLLHLDWRIELHHEVVTLMVLGLMLRRRARKVKLPPVLNATYHASVVENLLAGDSGNPNQSSEDVLEGAERTGDCTL